MYILQVAQYLSSIHCVKRAGAAVKEGLRVSIRTTVNQGTIQIAQTMLVK